MGKDGLRKKYLDVTVEKTGPDRRRSLQRVYEKNRALACPSWIHAFIFTSYLCFCDKISDSDSETVVLKVFDQRFEKVCRLDEFAWFCFLRNSAPAGFPLIVFAQEAGRNSWRESLRLPVRAKLLQSPVQKLHVLSWYLYLMVQKLHGILMAAVKLKTKTLKRKTWNQYLPQVRRVFALCAFLSPCRRARKAQ